MPGCRTATLTELVPLVTVSTPCRSPDASLRKTVSLGLPAPLPAVVSTWSTVGPSAGLPMAARRDAYFQVARAAAALGKDNESGVVVTLHSVADFTFVRVKGVALLRPKASGDSLGEPIELVKLKDCGCDGACPLTVNRSTPPGGIAGAVTPLRRASAFHRAWGGHCAPFVALAQHQLIADARRYYRYQRRRVSRSGAGIAEPIVELGRTHRVLRCLRGRC